MRRIEFTVGRHMAVTITPFYTRRRPFIGTKVPIFKRQTHYEGWTFRIGHLIVDWFKRPFERQEVKHA